MKQRLLKDIDIVEISLVFSPNTPVVPAARPLIIKGTPFLEDPATLEILRGLNAVVEQLKADQAAKEQAAQAPAPKRPQRIRRRSFDPYEDYENSAAQARRKSARETFYAECHELAQYNKTKQSDLGK